MFRNVPKGVPPVNNTTSPGIYRGARTANRGRGRGRGRGGSGRGGFNNRRPPQDPTKRGLFADGIWLCNCAPRLPAEHFKVKKDGPNQGRWFYTCQNSEGRRCDFFLWDEDAKPREEAAVLSGKRDEPRATPGAIFSNVDEMAEARGEARRSDAMPSQMSTQSQTQDSSVTLGRSSSSSGNHLTNKRSLADAGFDFDDDDEDAFPWALTGKEADDLERQLSHAPETPRKTIKTDVYATPGTTGKRQLPWLDYGNGESVRNPETPSKPNVSLTLPSPPLTKTAAASAQGPSRFHDPLADPAASSALTSEVFTVLNSSSISLPQNISSQLRAVLNKFDLKTQGICRGRDMVRLALKAKDAKVVELNARIAALEAEREVDRARIRGLRLKDSKIG